MLVFFVFLFSYIPRTSSQLTPQNIQVFYPFHLLLPPPPPPPLPPPPPPPPPTATTNPSNTSIKPVAIAVALIAASTLLLSALFLFILVRCNRIRKAKEIEQPDSKNPVLLANDQFTRFEGVKGVIVDEEGLDVVYWKNVDDDDNGSNKETIFKKEHLRIDEKEEEEEKKKMMSIENGGRMSKKIDVRIQEDENNSQNNILMKSQLSSRSPPPTPPPPPLPPQLPALPPQQLPPAKTDGDGLRSSSRPAEVKLKALHWDKVNTYNMRHPMAWDKLDNGSFRFDGDLMEALFGTVARNKQSPRPNPNSPTPKPDPKSGQPSQIFLLNTRKSQNIAIILRSLTISRQDIIDCLLEGKNLDIDTLEKLTRISPTKPEEQLILNYDQDITKLADAESFLYHILITVPSAFTRFNAMFFKSNYTSDVSKIKNTLQTLETACNELRTTRGIFVKLLEAILKAGNRMNSGTSRGNAQAFDMNSLLKLSDVRSSDGRTTLLHFVVEEVVRLEGKRCMINLNNDGGLGNDYIMNGLPIVGGVSSEFSSVKKAAGIDYDELSRSCSGLIDRLSEITETVKECGEDGGLGFVEEMERFVAMAEGEVGVLREEEGRVMEVVKRTNEYYRVGSSKDKGKKQFRLFVTVKTFLDMVDKACVDIAIDLEMRRTGGGDDPVKATSANGTSVKFPVLPSSFISSSSSESDEDF